MTGIFKANIYKFGIYTYAYAFLSMSNNMPISLRTHIFDK